MKKKCAILTLLSLILMNFTAIAQAVPQSLSFPCDSFNGIVGKNNVSLYEIFESDRDAFYDDFTTLQKSGDGEAYVIFEIPYADTATLTTYHLPSEAMDFSFAVSNDCENWQIPAYTKEIKEEEGKWTTYTYILQNLSSASDIVSKPTATPTSTPTADVTATDIPIPTTTPTTTESPLATAEPVVPPEASASPNPQNDAGPNPIPTEEESETNPCTISAPQATTCPKENNEQNICKPSASFDINENQIDKPAVKGVSSLSEETTTLSGMDTRYLKITWPATPTWWTPLVAELNVTCTEPIPQRIEINTTEPWVIPLYDTNTYPLSAVLLDQMENPYPAELHAEITCDTLAEIFYDNENIVISSEYPEGALLKIRFSSEEFKLSSEKSIRLKKALLGDLNQNLILEEDDLNIALSYLGKTENSSDWKNCRLADINFDGKIDVLDIAFIARNCKI